MEVATRVGVRCLTTGVVRPKRRARGVRRYLPGGWADETLPVHVFLVEHPDGLCLFDAGQTTRAAVPGYLPRWHPFLRLSRFELEGHDEAAAQLSTLCYEPSAVRWVVLSHLHTDHVGGLEPFAAAEVVVSRTEWERSTGVAGKLRGYLPQHWPPGCSPSLVSFDTEPFGPFAGSVDLAGDGRLVLVPTPGHTPGHLSLLVRGAEVEGGYLLAGDLALRAAELEVKSPGVAAFCRAEGIVPLTSHDPMATSLLAS